MPATVLHLLSQRPLRTGSGITLDAIVRAAREAGWSQHVVFAGPPEDGDRRVGDLPAARHHPLVFGQAPLGFPVPGMSDVMPYPSTVFSTMDASQWRDYEAAWRSHLERVVAQTRPRLIHSHHVWQMSALLKDVAPDVPVVTHCHGTDLRQFSLCPSRAEAVRRGCLRNERFVVLHDDNAAQLATLLGVPAERIAVVGAGYREELFHAGARAAPAGELLYVGKLSAAKGVPWLLEAFDRLRRRHPRTRLHLVGSGSGPQGKEAEWRIRALGDAAVLHGPLDQPHLAELMRRCSVCVLPSLYEGLPLVLVEARACGCRLVATALPGIVGHLAPALGDALELIDLPRLH